MSEVEYLFICLMAIFICQFIEHLLMSFAHFSIGLSVFFLLSLIFGGPFYTKAIRLLSVIQFIDIFPECVTCPFGLLMIVFGMESFNFFFSQN